MAIDVNNARFLLALKKNGLDFKEVATVGRQGLFIPPALVKELFDEFGVPLAVNNKGFFLKESEAYSEPFFHELGASSITTIDYSDYEQATVIQDMNKELDAALKNRFSLLIDSGSIEHMFNFPQAAKNYMDILKPGGHLLLVNMPVNNHMGHGFYQFSPELFYNLFSEANGFKMKKIYMAEDFPYADFYEVVNPKDVKERVGLANDEPVLLFMIAQKIQAVDQLQFPIQNDYVQSWASGNTGSTTTGEGGIKKLIQSVFKGLSRKTYFEFTVRRNWNRIRRKYSLKNDSFYKKTDLRSQNIPVH